MTRPFYNMKKNILHLKDFSNKAYQPYVKKKNKSCPMIKSNQARGKHSKEATNEKNNNKTRSIVQMFFVLLHL